MGRSPFFAITVKLTFTPNAAIAIPKIRYAIFTNIGIATSTAGTYEPIALATIKPPINQGIGTRIDSEDSPDFLRVRQASKQPRRSLPVPTKGRVITLQ